MKKNNRWWENYLVRYLAGNIFAVIVLFFLFINYGDRIGTKFCNTRFSENYSICKESYINKNSDFTKEIYGFIFQSSTEIRRSNEILGNSSNKIQINAFKNEIHTTTDITFMSVLIVGVFSFLYMYISSIPIYLAHILRFWPNITQGYKESTFIRDTMKNNSCHIDGFTTKYVESYTHMREHGNAFGIILMEILFAYLLVETNFSMYFIISWLFLGFLGWVLGIRLEYEMLSKSNQYCIECVCLFILIIILNIMIIFSY